MILKRPDVSVVAMHRSQHQGARLQWLQRCLESLKDVPEAGLTWELIVVDSWSTDASRQWLLDQYGRVCLPQGPSATLIFDGPDLTYAESNNRAMAWARAPYIALLNNDCQVHPGWLTEAVAMFRNNPRVGHVAHLVLRGNGNILSHGANFDQHGGTRIPHISEDPSVIQASKTYGYAGFGVYRRDLWERLGGLPELPGVIYFDDAFLGVSIWGLGYEVRLQPTSVITHFIDHTSGDGDRAHHSGALVQNWACFKRSFSDFLLPNNGFDPEVPGHREALAAWVESQRQGRSLDETVRWILHDKWKEAPHA